MFSVNQGVKSEQQDQVNSIINILLYITYNIITVALPVVR